MSTTWNNELELKLIECYQSEPILWQSKHKEHKNKIHDAWTRISDLLNIPVVELKKKRIHLYPVIEPIERNLRIPHALGQAQVKYINPSGLRTKLWTRFWEKVFNVNKQ